MNIKVVVEEKKVIKNNFFSLIFIQYFIVKLGFFKKNKRNLCYFKNYYKKYETFVQYQKWF